MPVIEALSDAGADVNYKREDGATAILTASAGQHSNPMKALITRGADVSEALLLVATEHYHDNQKLAVILTLAAAGADMIRPGHDRPDGRRRRGPSRARAGAGGGQGGLGPVSKGG
jgi:ankyrin repeat protein